MTSPFGPAPAFQGQFGNPAPRNIRQFPRVERISRKEFLTEFGKNYRPGQHVTLIGPTQKGKSKLSRQMARTVISPALRVTTLLGKPPKRERTWAEEAAEELNLRIIKTWPPKFDPWQALRHGLDKDRNGFILRPHQTLKDLGQDAAELKRQFKAAIIGLYGSRKKNIILIDEAHHVHVDLGLKRECEAPLMRGAPDCGIWHNLQRGRYVSQLLYDQPSDVLFFRDDDRANQERYAEIGSIDSRFMTHVVSQLKLYQGPGGSYSETAWFHRETDSLRIVGT